MTKYARCPLALFGVLPFPFLSTLLLSLLLLTSFPLLLERLTYVRPVRQLCDSLD